LVDGGVSRQTVNVFISLGVPDSGTLCASEYNREGMVVVRGVFVFGVDGGGS